MSVDETGPTLPREVSEHVPALRRYTRYLTRNAAEAEDLEQTTVMRAIGALDRFRPGSDMRAWLFTIARNQFLYERRQRRLEQRKLEQMPVPAGPRGRQASRDELSDLQRLLPSLPPTLRDALLLVGAQGLSYEEASLRCGVSAVTIRARVCRARSLLACRVEDALRAA